MLSIIHICHVYSYGAVDLPNLDVTEGAAAPVRKHFHSNKNKTGFIIFSVSCAVQLAT